ncbi:MAG: arylsulfatase [Candidatus Solibacter usitatus]|nr:arylsulfatase [Candidatus Solibacter usitatus]
MQITRRQFAGTLAATQASAADRKPNIIWIMADDLGIGDLGCYGQKHIRTPNIDKIAAEGMRFTEAYAGCTVCAPSRSVLMTGKHMGHTTVRSNPGGVPLEEGDITVAQLLKQAGYTTGGYGKWGLGDIGTTGVPSKKGFDEFYGYLNQVHAHFFYPRILVHNEKEVPLPGNENGKRTTYSHDAIAEKALAFIRRSASGPFFCYVPFTVPHLELLVPEDSIAEYRGKITEAEPFIDPRKHYADQREPRACYAGMVTRMDRDIGRIMALLKELRIDENTIVFFTSDNGGAVKLWGGDYFQSTGPYRGRKTDLYEGGIRTPMLARWPKKIKAGSLSKHPWYFADFMATAAEIAGVKTPPNDGISVLPALLGKKQRTHDYLYWELPRYEGTATGRFRKELPMQAARMGEWKAVRPKPDAAVELYNLKDDIGETKDLATQRPEILKKMEEILRIAHEEPHPQTEPRARYWEKA